MSIKKSKYSKLETIQKNVPSKTFFSTKPIPISCLVNYFPKFPMPFIKT